MNEPDQVPLRLFDVAFDPTTGRSHVSDPWTSRAAAEATAPRTGTQRRRVLEVLDRADTFGATDYELGLALGIFRTAAGTRRKELQEEGFVTEHPDRATRETDTGARALIHVITPIGRNALRAARIADQDRAAQRAAS